ncbi:branched-chain amino acid ABC transporter permease [Homoserinibacter sp. YIM 151385]|uniref:branched-chain amino acid ABC transporter permease n=1 Tax=Homoserinibacter sp. YIM 151385 TaxID=2985506 RepID=UPI0022F13AC8|nr:branched-chain amino acid ABC transporter permease [Homoserinibacter sp. YIM 151385]WBU37724.1 branched-chain amino acid ABC transporter permease [Homoserinibacter sp. YIM 151385]
MDFGSILLSAGTALISPTTAAYALAAIGLGVHFGYAGLLNFGQAGFMAVGAYTFAITTLTLGFPFWLAILATIVAASVFALILGIPTLRLRADYLAIVTIAAAEIVRFIVTTSTGGLDDTTGGASGLNGYNAEFAGMNPLPAGTSLLGLSGTPLWGAIFGWALVIIATVLVWALMRSPWGRVVKGIREDEDAVRSLGKNVYSYKMQALVLGGVMGAMAGVIFILPRAVQPGNYGTALTFFIWTALLLGGAATVFGPIVGAMIFWGVLTLSDGLLRGLVAADVLTFISSTQVGQIRFIIVGIALMLLVVFRPQGIFGNKKELSFNV